MEPVVLVDNDGNAQGTADKATVHSNITPLHLAFSCYLFDRDRRFLLTRRAQGKQSFPGVWTNSCCGHPAPGEGMREAVRRRVQQELGLTSVSPLVLVLPGFRYRAEMNGIVENELCPVYMGVTDTSLNWDPAEVGEAIWTDWTKFCGRVRAKQFRVSPWCSLQVAELAGLGPDPLGWPPAADTDLPQAARC